ncbi:MAG: acetyl-CoA carboxylase biotin carboxylase subunit, partial [Planctomycetaceae bacterium]|nr:acetyl-CoA carboxylase biotin carboxylase subunit [Planctomycetaceae bacterium]
PVTEQVTGIDLIQAQIRVAAGEKLDWKQKDIGCNGWSMEARINAEDPDEGFRGCPGTITRLRIPGGFGVRFDSHVYEGYRIPPNYDSMIGKLIVHKPTRDEAIACLKRALDETVIEGEGIRTTIPLTRRILDHKVFVDGTGDTKFVEREWYGGA